MSTTLQQPEVAGFPAELLAGADKSPIDHGPYYIYCPGETVHRATIGDGTDHCFAGVVTCVVSGGRWVDYTTAAKQSILTKTRPTDRNGGSQQELMNPFMASAKADAIYIENKHRGVVWIHAFDRIMPNKLRLDDFNALIGLPIGCEREDFPNFAMPVPPPDIAKMVEEKGVLAIREAHLRAVYERLRLASQDDLTKVWMEAIQQMLEGFDIARRNALQGLQESEREIQGNRKDIFDPRDERWMKLTGWKPKNTSGQQTVKVEVAQQQGAPAPAQDVERKECPSCGELIAIKAKKCRYCQEVLVQPDAQAEVTTDGTAPLRRRKTLEEKQDEARERNS